jgi:hypothetical protein
MRATAASPCRLRFETLTMNALSSAQELNAIPLDRCLDRRRVASILDTRPLMFSDTQVFVSAENMQWMADFVAAMEQVTALPGWRDQALAEAPITARHEGAGHGVFFGYDFHITADGPKLIEINTNAGGGFLNVALLQAQTENSPGLVSVAEVERHFVGMFVSEWRAAGGMGGVANPGLVAIVDEQPDTQYLNPDFELCRVLLEAHGIQALICDPAALVFSNGELTHEGRRIDLVYNRLTDFLLQAPAHAALRDAWLADAAVVTPNPRSYALFADKRHMAKLSDDAWLASIGVDAVTRGLIARVVPHTELVLAANAEDIHTRRKKLFFKPATGFGSKATYRGLNVTNRVLDEIMHGNYVAQELVPPPTRSVKVDAEIVDLKFDLRCYTYAGEVQLVAARLWQGQTTNFRTPGGGFTPVVIV